MCVRERERERAMYTHTHNRGLACRGVNKMQCAAGVRGLAVFDFDCTLSVKHVGAFDAEDHHHRTITAPSPHHHRTVPITVPSHYAFLLSLSHNKDATNRAFGGASRVTMIREMLHTCRQVTVTAPSLHHHCTITAPSPPPADRTALRSRL